MSTRCINMDCPTIRATAPVDILKSVLTALNQGNISAAVEEFGDGFTFHDHALDLEFTVKERLMEFFQKSHELFPDTVMEVVATFENGDYAIAEWNLTATDAVSSGSIRLRSPISLSGVSIVHVKDNKITLWSDYYDQVKSRRVALAAAFVEWVEY